MILFTRILTSIIISVVIGLLFNIIIKKRGFRLIGNIVLGIMGAVVGVILWLSFLYLYNYYPSDLWNIVKYIFYSYDSLGFIISEIIGASILLLLSKLIKNELPKLGNNISPIKEINQSKIYKILHLQNSKSYHSKNNIFISYRREDNPDITGRIYDRLINHFNKEQVFLDVDSIPIGVDFRKHLDEKVGICEILIAVIGNHWFDSTNDEGKRRIDEKNYFVRIEIESALKRGIPVVPLLINGAKMPKEEDLPPTLKDLAYRQALFIRSDPDFHKDVDRLISGLEMHFNKTILNV